MEESSQTTQIMMRAEEVIRRMLVALAKLARYKVTSSVVRRAREIIYLESPPRLLILAPITSSGVLRVVHLTSLVPRQPLLLVQVPTQMSLDRPLHVRPIIIYLVLLSAMSQTRKKVRKHQVSSDKDTPQQT